MKTITYKLKDLEEKKEKKVTLKLGYVGENEHVQIRIDCSEIWENYPNAVASLAVEPPEGEKYPAIVTRDGDMVCWTVKDSDLVNDGYGRIQLTFTEGSEIQKTVICRTKVDESIIGSGTAPDPIADFVAEANEALAELEAAEVHGPVIGEDGYWYIWSKDAGEYVKTDTKAQGEDGQQGPAGKDGADGAPGQDGHTPVKGTDYWTQQDQADIVAAAALETVSAVIDDTAGDGDTNKTWSADKISETTGQLLNDIDGLKPTAQQSDIGKALILKTIDQTGKPTAFEYGEAGGGSVDPSVVEQKVDEWLEENISNPDSPPLDRSLSSASSAAPADMVGVVSSELNMQDYPIDLLRDAVYTSGKKIDEDGSIQSVSTYELWEITYDGSYDKFTAVVYSGSNYHLRALTFHNSSDEAIATYQYPNTSGDYKSTFTDQAVPAGTSKIYISSQKNLGITTATASVKKSKRLADVEKATDGISALVHSTKNLFDISTQVAGMIYESSGALLVEYPTHRASDFIEVEPNTIYTISAYNKTTGEFDLEGLRYAIYTSNKTFISGAKNVYQFRTPSTAAYVRFSMNADYVEKFQFERRAFATKYIEHDGYAVVDNSDLMFMNFPSKVFAVNGLEYNWYLFNVRPDKFENEFQSNYVIRTNNKLKQYGRFLRLVESNTSTSDIVVTATAKDSTRFGVKKFNIVPKNAANLQSVSVLILGDSTTANGYVPQYLYEFGGENHLITTLGTLGTAPYNHEGRSGWRLSDYFTQATNNPFYNPSTETFDAAYYFTQTGVALPDIFIVNIGINDMHYNSNNPTDARIKAASFIEQMNAVIESVKDVSSSIKVAVCLTTPPNVDPYSFGAAGVNIIGYDDYRIANLILCEALIDEYDYRESEGIYLIPINSCLDTKYNMPTETAYPNSRSTEQITVPTNAANVHPNQAGYHQIADEIYAFICSLYVSA